MDQCPDSEIANLPESGVGECWCQQGRPPVPDSSGYQCINPIVAARPIFARFSQHGQAFSEKDLVHSRLTG